MDNSRILAPREVRCEQGNGVWKTFATSAWSPGVTQGYLGAVIMGWEPVWGAAIRINKGDEKSLIKGLPASPDADDS